MRAPPRGSAARAATPHCPSSSSYREADGKFYFKLSAGDGSVLLQSRAFDAPKDAGRASAALVEAGGDARAIAALLLQDAAHSEDTLPVAEIVDALGHLKAEKLAKNA